MGERRRGLSVACAAVLVLVAPAAHAQDARKGLVGKECRGPSTGDFVGGKQHGGASFRFYVRNDEVFVTVRQDANDFAYANYETANLTLDSGELKVTATADDITFVSAKGVRYNMHYDPAEKMLTGRNTMRFEYKTLCK